MKIIEANSGVFSNFEVLKFLKCRGASKDQARILNSIAASEFKVYDYLVGTPACTQTIENINEFKEKCIKYDLAEAEVLNIINARPANIIGIYPIIEDIDLRLGNDDQELVDMVVEVFPPRPGKTDESDTKTTDAEKTEDQNDSDKGKPANEEEMQTSFRFMVSDQV